MIVFFFAGLDWQPGQGFPGHLNIGRIQIPLNAEGISWQFSKMIFLPTRSWQFPDLGDTSMPKIHQPILESLGGILRTSQPKTESLVVTVPFVKVRGYSGHEDI